jgi:A/G-specific adenine glycosylase
MTENTATGKKPRARTDVRRPGIEPADDLPRGGRRAADTRPPARTAIVEPVIAWFRAEARDLPWRRPEATAWAVMVSEFMLQQTPVVRVLPVYESWVTRWPSPAALAAEAAGEAVRAWGRLGYPRRAMRLHAAATAIVDDFDGVVPSTCDELSTLPGVGEYTAAAIASFAYGKRHIVLDTNVRRVLSRAVSAVEFPAASTTPADRRTATSLLPERDADAAEWAAASMELGALLCTARSPRCDQCPILEACAWVAAGKPPYEGPPRKGQSYEGTDRQARGRLLAVLRDSHAPVERSELDASWPKDVAQRDRALDSLLADGLVVLRDEDTYSLAH